MYYSLSLLKAIDLKENIGGKSWMGGYDFSHETKETSPTHPLMNNS